MVCERSWAKTLEFFTAADADIFLSAGDQSCRQGAAIEMELPGYHQYWNYAEKKGYSGTAIFTQEEPCSVHYGIDIEEHTIRKVA